MDQQPFVINTNTAPWEFLMCAEKTGGFNLVN